MGDSSKSVQRLAEERFQARIDALNAKAWPAIKWQGDFVGFCSQVLHVQLEPEQSQIGVAVQKPMSCVAVVGGQKIGKSFLIGCIIWWFWCCFPKARVIFTATTKEQGDNVIWDEVQSIFRIALEYGNDLLSGGSELHQNPGKGIKSRDGRTIRGMSVRELEAMGGISGPNLLFIADEASSLKERFAVAMLGNQAGGGRQLWTANPIRNEGPLYDAFHKDKEFWVTFQISALDVAKRLAKEGRHVPGMATLEGIARNARMWGGVESPFYRMRVLGQFVESESGRIIGLHWIIASETEHAEGPTPEDMACQLCIGVDPAGEGEGRDRWAFAAVRGRFVLDQIETHEGLTTDQAMTVCKQFARKYNAGRPDLPRFKIDIDGRYGAEFFGKMIAESERLKIWDTHNAFDVEGIKASAPALGGDRFYPHVRDELYACGATWIRTGGKIPRDFELEADLHAASWIDIGKGRQKATDKKDLRKALNRSPDKGDALFLAVFDVRLAYPEHIPAYDYVVPELPEGAEVGEFGGSGGEIQIDQISGLHSSY